jgi:hypothetical protein
MLFATTEYQQLVQMQRQILRWRSSRLLEDGSGVWRLLGFRMYGRNVDVFALVL